jgi:hypothetical protein
VQRSSSRECKRCRSGVARDVALLVTCLSLTVSRDMKVHPALAAI